MNPARTAFCVLVLISGITASFVLLPRALHTLHALNLQAASLTHASRRQGPKEGSGTSAGRAHVAPTHRARPGSDRTFTELAHAGVDIAEALLVLAVLMLLLVARRMRRRSRREYALYELHLSTHDQAKGQDLEDMVEQIANNVRVWLFERIRNGQPYFAVELICGVKPDNGGPLEMEWSINIRCEPATASALDGAISATYPDVRLGRIHGEQPLPRPGVLREPGCLMRFRKERSFVYPLIAAGEEQASAPLEQIARAQVAVGAPTVVRFQLTPTPLGFEALARTLYRRHENKLVRRERSSLPRGGLTSTFNRAEMRAAERTQNRSLFWLEIVVAADTSEACKTVAAAVQSRRGENRLHRRWMTVRQRLYRRRFPRALGPLLPAWRSLVSAAEVAHLLELPSARMKGVPVRRIPLPRIPAPPELIRGSRRPRTSGTSGSPARREPELVPVGAETKGHAVSTNAYTDLAPDQLCPMLRAENAEVLIHPVDRKYGSLLIGGQGCGKTSALLSFYLNDIEDENAAPIVIDPKSELSRVCLRMTPPDCGKRVWFLDLGRPAFGMSPLRPIGDRPLAIEAAQIADNIVAALLDINENQIFQSSRRYLTHSVIGAIAIANKQGRRARLEDVYTLLRPGKEEFRNAVAEACADPPDLDQTAEFFRSELPDDLKMATSAVTQRLDPPRNKISGLTGVPPLRRFFNHPTDVALREIVMARDILIVDANMGAIGTENSKACMLFILRMLHTQLQRQVHLPEHERPRVPLLVDEAHYVASGENVVDQIATHRAAGLEAAFGLQYFAQLGSASEHQQKILKGVLNLLQSRFLFRMGDAQDAEQATRIAMAVYATMIRDDPDSRARLRVTPEQALNFPNYYCLASWIANGTRAPSFMGQTYPLPEVGDEWAAHHLAAQDARVGPYPEELESTLASSTEPLAAAQESTGEVADSPAATGPPETDKPLERPTQGRRQPKSATKALTRREVRVDYEAPDRKEIATTESPIRKVVGLRLAEQTLTPDDAPPSDTLHELAFLDRINEIGPAEETGGEGRLPRLYDEDYTIMALLDRVGLAPVTLIARAALPGRAPRTVFDRLVKLYRHGLIARHTTGLHGHSSTDGKPPLLHSLTRRGLEVAQQRQPAPAISPKREWKPIEQPRAGRLAHDLHALGWAIEFHHAVGEVATDRWRTPRYATGRYPVPQIGNGQRRHPITLNEIPVPDGQAIIDVELKTFCEIKPDLSLELRIERLKLTFDLLVEIDLTARPSYNREKFFAYDAFLCGWSLAHPRYQAQGTRPAVVFVSPTHHAALACAREADELMTGRIGAMGAPAEHWYYAGRDHLFFASEGDIHRGDVSALALPPHPRGLRERLMGDRELALSRVSVLTHPGRDVV